VAQRIVACARARDFQRRSDQAGQDRGDDVSEGRWDSVRSWDQ
jgi:hypothetical protein